MSTGHIKLLQQFCADGFTYMFGNPGTSEEGLLDSLHFVPEIQYVMALQESVALAMADGYCRSTGRAALVQLHSGVGLGNAIGLLYQAKRGYSPLVVISGEAGVAYSAFDAQMACDLVTMARPVTKFATRVEHPGSLLRLARRAIKEAMTPPTGPVYLAVPQDMLDAINDEPVMQTIVPDTRVMPYPESITNVARMLAAATNPLILMGDGIARSGAQAELGRLAEALGAKVWGVNNSDVNLPQSHPLFCGITGHMFGTDSARVVKGADVVLIVGTYVFPEVFPSLTNPFEPGTKVIHIELDPYEIAKNHPVDIAFVSDPKYTLDALATALDSIATPAQKRAGVQRTVAIGSHNADLLTAAKAGYRQASRRDSLHMSDFAVALSKRLPVDAILFDESLTNSQALTVWLPANVPGQYFQTRGGSLGVGFPGAIGIKLAQPDRTVIGFSGDGGSMYTIQALWTAAHHKIGAKFVVCNNGSYRLLKLNLLQYWKNLGMPSGAFPWCFNVDNPIIDYVGLAHAMGIPGVRVRGFEDIGPAIDAMLANNNPFLVDLALDGTV